MSSSPIIPPSFGILTLHKPPPLPHHQNHRSTKLQPRESSFNISDHRSKTPNALFCCRFLVFSSLSSRVTEVRQQHKMGAVEGNIKLESPPETTMENIEALLEAARYNDMDDVASLTSNGVPIDSKDDQGRTALHMAAANGHIDIVEYLISRGASLNSENVEKNTPLHWACLNGHVEAVKKLIMAGANVSVLNSHERTPMDEALTRGKLEMMDAINEAEALVELRGAMVSSKET
ncbi:hypothetical protein P8452_22057 [Trifolium repens]|nr:hypothetical protein P8452_22057 [Trifolium repens]